MGSRTLSSSSSATSLMLGSLRVLLRREESGLWLLLRTEPVDAANCGSYLLRNSATLWLRVVVGDGNVDLDDGVSGASLEPATEGS